MLNHGGDCFVSHDSFPVFIVFCVYAVFSFLVCLVVSTSGIASLVTLI